MKTKLLAATAIIAANLMPIAVSPAYADTTGDPAVDAQLLAVCFELVPPGTPDPDDPPGTSPPPLTITLGNPHVTDSSPGVGQVVTFESGSEHRHGGSPNIFGVFHVTETAGFTEYTFDCVVQNTSSGNFPRGLQRPNQVLVIQTGQTIDTFDHRVICNSPTRNPGIWRNQNGYTGNCTTLGASFYTLLQEPDPAGIGTPIPSNSLPQ